MPRLIRKTGTLGLAFTAYEVWRKIPRQHRRAILVQARRHGPTLVRTLATKRKPGA